MAEPISGSTLMCILTGGVSLLYRACKSVKCGNIKCIVIPTKCGKSTLIGNLTDFNFKILDLEENALLSLSQEERDKLNQMKGNSSFNLHYYPLVKKYLDNIKENFKHNNLLIFCSDIELAKYCGITKKNIYSFVPSNRLTNEILNRVVSQNTTEKQIFESSRLNVLLKNINLKSYDSYDELKNLVMNKFKLKSKL